ncbi:MAG: methionine--tRNA ligase subunit beta [Candidatus Omnitrophica bacterium]|nr:methionine--tRNA ligase subunit beta [Candidatus Omnitrophota bacterium]
MITYEDFSKIELKIAKIIDAREHPSADRLYILDIDLGGEKRQIVAGIRNHYAIQELIGKNIAVVCNLQPALIRGIESNGMLLAASSGNELSILTIEKDLPAGAMIR